MRIYKAKDYKDMSRKAANILSAQIIMKPDCTLGLATGSSPIGIYDQLVEWYKKGDLDFSEVTTVNLDEYKGLPKDNDQSYYYFMHKHLFDRVNINPNKTYLPNGMEMDSKKETQRYTELIQSLGGIADDVPKQAYTMGIKTIMHAKKIVLIANGIKKAPIIQKAFFGPVTPQVPASILQLHNDVTLIADEEALSCL